MKKRFHEEKVPGTVWVAGRAKLPLSRCRGLASRLGRSLALPGESLAPPRRNAAAVNSLGRQPQVARRLTLRSPQGAMVRPPEEKF
jgi:hypothetical protein